MDKQSNICRHFGLCGGCLSQNVSYEEQLVHKSSSLRTLLADKWTGEIPITPSPVLFCYRNKIDPGFSLKRYPEPPAKDFIRETLLGFKERGRWRWPIAIEECLIAPEDTDKLFLSIGKWMSHNGLCAYDSRTEKGYLRNLIVRDGKRTGERMVAIITVPGELPDKNAFVSLVCDSFNASSVYHGEFSGKAEVATADKLTLLYGCSHITEKLFISIDNVNDINATVYETPRQFLDQERRKCRNLSFRISPLSFFQTNPLAAERLYGIVADWVRIIRPVTLYDLYGGAGGMGLCCSQYAANIISVESVQESSNDGRFNADRNGVDNIVFHTDSVRNYLRTILDNGVMSPGSAVVLDPPRAGMHPKAISRLMQLRPEHILYVSCNPKRMVEELPSFLESYTLASVSSVDMFPHTPHVEVVAALELR